MENILVVDCKSTGTNFIEDIYNRGYNPIVLELKPGNQNVETYKQLMKSNYDRIDYDFELFYEKDTYEETLDMIRQLHPVVVVPGSEQGVVLATKLANDLDLSCNSIDNLDAMTKKDKMHERLAERGLRHIRGKVVSSVEDAVEFYDANSLEEVVIKPVRGASSVGVRICLNKQEMIDHLTDQFDKTNSYGDENEVLLVQERINGEEYIVNTVSCDGIHRITLIWKYEKVRNSEGAILYDMVKTVNDLNIGEAELAEYAYDVVDAIGIKYGPVHGEYMVDKNGPVLIEVNCRPCGANMSCEFLDKISGQHETDSILDAYLNPFNFHEKRKKPYNLSATGALKIFIVPEDIWAKSAPINNISPKLQSYYDTTLQDIEDMKHFVMTEDLKTSCGYIYLVHEDENIVDRDIDFLRSVERNVFDLILNADADENYELDELGLVKNLQNALSIGLNYGNGILITDQFLDGINMLQVGLEDIKNVNGKFDFVVVNLNKSFIEKNSLITVDIVFDILSFIKVNGYVFIPKTTYDFIPGGRKGIEALIKSLNLKIVVPPYRMKNVVIASKTNI
ncbi:ATP-grasp domain-containing protein [Methanobrevibacter sp.]|uniref:ATP-grasp domain-containing protein n=1 Tax=Methanobrevibacter sp. TaxID=66852 RepID=UPI00388E568E